MNTSTRHHIIPAVIFLSFTRSWSFTVTPSSLFRRSRHNVSLTDIGKPSIQDRPNNNIYSIGRIASFSSLPATKSSSSSSSSFPTTPWKSCAQPGFDDFASYTVGPWILSSQSSNQSDEKPPQYDVEEVMRSCGGAVQGIREIPLTVIFPTRNSEGSSISEERTYHNRADGGFVYANDGSYSAGLEQWDWNAEIETEDEASSFPKLMMASLAFPSRRRVWTTSSLADLSNAAKSVMVKSMDEKEQLILQSTVLELARPIISKPDQNDENDTASGDSSITMKLQSTMLPNDIHWTRMQRVRMPNSNQAWTLARAKWECKIEEENNDKSNANNVTGGDEKNMAWSYIECIDQNDDIFGDVVNGESINLYMMAVCPVSNVARSVVRCYDKDGSLKSVAFLDGTLAMGTAEC